REEDLLPAIATARARFSELSAVREEVETLADALTAREAIERAKGILMQKDSLTEDAAFARLRKASQTSGRPMRAIAEAVIDACARWARGNGGPMRPPRRERPAARSARAYAAAGVGPLA